ncbi:MAG: DEAD/DEAH box helicase family protein [Pirellulaceae bacterium]
MHEGTFEFIERKIRSDAEGMAFGGDFEWLCKWFLENAPRYRGQFDKVWQWKDWPDRWGADAGIDLVARTRSGELWAIQAKADHPDRAIPKREIDSFLSESNRTQFAYRLLMATTDDIGATARRTLQGQEKPVGLVLRGHFLTEDVQWPVQIGEKAAQLARWKARPHQTKAIQAVVKGFRAHDRGQLIMACGTGKTLTALWIAERLQSSLTLVVVPSLSLVQQNLAEWGRHAAADFDTLVVCSDESVVQSKADAAIQSTADLGVKPTTKDAEIRRFLGQRRKRPAVVFATYQSSDRIAAAQAGKTKPFDLAICDEAHRVAGNAEGLFATVLDSKKIKAHKRLFMTATPRYFKEHIKRRAAELEYELVSMNDQHVFGPEFHVLTFHEAISAAPPLLTDYQVVVIGVTDREAKAWAEEARLVRTADGITTDARTLAAQIGLAKAMKKYDLRKIITFHSSVAKAARFVDPTLRDSLPGVIPHLIPSARPAGKLWTKHISGHTPAGQRATLLKGLGSLPDDTRGILSNCACLGEGVDVPVLDAVAFIDPKRSMVDIIQAVGRVIRKAAGKQIGTIVIPVFIDETEDADHVLSQSAFEPVWQVLKALRAHDRRLAVELDQLRLSLGTRSKTGGRINLPANIHLDIPRLLLSNFEQAFYVRTVEQATSKPDLTIEQILDWADAHHLATGEWPTRKSGTIENTVESWLGMNTALDRGIRGLPGGSSLAILLEEHRGRRRKFGLPDLTVEAILEWADDFNAITGKWPHRKSGQIPGTEETWSGIESSLIGGRRGLPGGTSLVNLLAEHRGKRHRLEPPNLTIEQILDWADAYYDATGEWPNQTSGKKIDGTDDSWRAIHRALSRGKRGLPGGTSLVKLLAEHRDRRNVQNLPDLTIEQILDWADAHRHATGDWPKLKSEKIEGTDETWAGINANLKLGYRSLPGDMTLATLLAEHRGKRRIYCLPNLTIEQILDWADAHYQATGEWPKMQSGMIEGTDEKWLGIDDALRRGTRGMPTGSSLAKLLCEYRDTRNVQDLSELTIAQILDWADAHYEATGEWPKNKSGKVAGTGETWSAISSALQFGNRGLPGGSSLARLLAELRGKRNTQGLPDLTIEQILDWADAHQLATGEWPTSKSGQVSNTDETWSRINSALTRGSRGLPPGSSLAKLLAEHRGKRHRLEPPNLTIEQILDWADAYYDATGEWPNQTSGKIEGTIETWLGIDNALRRGSRDLPPGSSLAKLLAEHRGKRNIRDLPELTIEQVLEWADAHHEATGKWPNRNSGQIKGTDETWSRIHGALINGLRGLSVGKTIAKVLAEHRDRRNTANLPALTIEQILDWADAHQLATGAWPNAKSGKIEGTDENWSSVNYALRRGIRGLHGGSSLAKLRAEHRSN